MSTETPVTLLVDCASVAAVEVATSDKIGWHPGAVQVGYWVETVLPERDASRVTYELRMRGYGVTRFPEKGRQSSKPLSRLTPPGPSTAERNPVMSTKANPRTIARHHFTNALEASGFNEYKIRESYSGRGMDGASCFGIVVEPSDERRVFVALGWACGFAEASDGSAADDAMQMWERLIRCASVDSMARNVIVYFPEWTLAD